MLHTIHPGVVLMFYALLSFSAHKRRLKNKVPCPLVHIMTVNSDQHQASIKRCIQNSKCFGGFEDKNKQKFNVLFNENPDCWSSVHDCKLAQGKHTSCEKS